MKRVRGWILGSALGCFASGMMVGSAIPGTMEASSGRGGPADSPDEDYVRQLVTDYGLDAAQERLLRLVLQAHAMEKLQAFGAADFESLPEALKGQLRLAQGRVASRIRALLTAEQRQRYDAQARSEGGR